MCYFDASVLLAVLRFVLLRYSRSQCLMVMVVMCNRLCYSSDHVTAVFTLCGFMLLPSCDCCCVVLRSVVLRVLIVYGAVVRLPSCRRDGDGG